MHHRTFLWLTLIISLLFAAPGQARAEKPPTARRVSVSIVYERRDVYGGRLANSKAAFGRLQRFFDTNPFGERRTFSFLKDVLGNSMRADDGFVMTMYGFGYGACGAPSLLNQLVRTAMFLDSDGNEKPVFEARRWTRERNPTYGLYGVAIFLDLEGGRSTDYRWRLNPAYDGPPPQITIEFEDTSPHSAVVSMTMVYADESPASPAQPMEGEVPKKGEGTPLNLVRPNTQEDQRSDSKFRWLSKASMPNK